MMQSSAEQRFLAKREEGDGCWLWNAALDRNGYGRFYFRGRAQWAHRVAYELFVAPIPEGFQVDHQCNTPACVRPDHLKAMTPRDNYLRSRHPNAVAAVTSTCHLGHTLSDALLEVRTTASGGTRTTRRCRYCNRARAARNRAGRR